MYESSDITSTRLVEQIKQASDAATILSLSREFAQFKPLNSPRDLDLDETPEGAVIAKVASLGPEHSLQGLADIAHYAAPQDHEPMNRGRRLAVSALSEWTYVISTAPLEPSEKVDHAYGIMTSVDKNVDLRRAAAAAVLTQSQKLEPSIARPFVEAVEDFAIGDENPLLLQLAEQANEERASAGSRAASLDRKFV